MSDYITVEENKLKKNQIHLHIFIYNTEKLWYKNNVQIRNDK